MLVCAKSFHLETLCDTIRAHADHLCEAHADRDVPFGDRIEARDERPLCLIAMLFKRNRTDRRRRSRLAVLILDRLPYEPFRLDDFQKHTVDCELCAVGSLHDVPPDAAWPQVHLAYRICEPRAAVPMHDVLGICDDIPNEGAGCIEHA